MEHEAERSQGSSELLFSWQDYLVFAGSLAIPLCIGVFFCLHKRKQQSTETFLVGKAHKKYVVFTCFRNKQYRWNF